MELKFADLTPKEREIYEQGYKDGLADADAEREERDDPEPYIPWGDLD